MPLLTLHHDDAPDRVLDTISVGETPLAVGREPGEGGWRVGEADRAVSRTHFTVCERDGGVWVQDLSANGLFTAAGPAPKHQPAPVDYGDVLRFGRFAVTVAAERLEETVFRSPFAAAAEGLRRPSARTAEAPAPAPDPTVFEGPFVRPLLAPVDATLVTLAVPSDWAPPRRRLRPSPPPRPQRARTRRSWRRSAEGPSST